MLLPDDLTQSQLQTILLRSLRRMDCHLSPDYPHSWPPCECRQDDYCRNHGGLWYAAHIVSHRVLLSTEESFIPLTSQASWSSRIWLDLSLS
jgi:hypothetical protein